MPDHQQAAVLALFEKIMGEDPTTPAPVRFALLSDEDKSVFREALAAAEPHLRRKWAEEVLNEGILGAGYSVLMNPNRGEHPVTTFTRAVKHMLYLLEGVGE